MVASQEAAKEKMKMNKKIGRANSEKLQQLDSLNWNSSLPENDDTSFSMLVGSNDFEGGGFLSLEEIDEAEYGLEIPAVDEESKVQVSKGKPKSKKRKRKIEDNSRDEADGASGDVVEAEVVEKTKVVNKKKKPKKKKGNKDTKNESSEAELKEKPGDVDAPVEVDKGGAQEELIDETEYYGWNNLRLHPLIMRSIYRLKFKEPTPIQKACIPAAAHQGKDVIGAAETGSGKTLAFGLPILQRLLEEREKDEKCLTENGEADNKLSQGCFLRALIITPTRELALQVTDHLKQAANGTNIKVVPIVGGMSTEKQERLLKARPEIVVGTPGRLWELMSGGEIHFVELHSLSFFVLDEADRMIENGHFRELQSIIDMLPVTSESIKGDSSDNQNCVTVSNLQRKKRQTFVFSATIALSADFRKKLKRGSGKSKSDNELNSIEALSERAGMRENAAVVDLTNASILANKLEESFIECREEDKDAYLYYILSVHGLGRTIVFCTSIAALRHISSILRTLGINVLTLHAQMQQRARLKAMDRFRANDHAILAATDVAARGLDIPGVRTVIHYQLPHSAEVYVHRSGRTARAFSDGCSIALISPNETSKFAELCRTFSKESFQRFPIELSYMPEVMKRISIARQMDKISQKDSKDKAKKTWFEKNADVIGLDLDDDDSEEERVNKLKQKKATSSQLSKLQQELKSLLSRPLQPKSLSNRFLAGGGISLQLQQQFEELARQRLDNSNGPVDNKRRKLLVIGQDCVEPLQALRSAGQEGCTDLKEISVKRRNVEDLKRKRKQEKKHIREQRRKEKKNKKNARN